MFISFPAQYAGDVGLPLILIAACVLDALCGDPKWFYSRVPHPVSLLGALIGRLEAALNNARSAAAVRRLSGGLLVRAVVLSCGMLGWLLAWGLRATDITGAWVAEAVVVAVLLAFRSLYDHVRQVASALDQGLEEGRAAVAHIVGRDPMSLDAPGVARAAVESAAENFSDGFVAPLFYYALFGLPGLFIYKAVNTLDSMVGYRNERYGAFGWAAARLDDAVNLPASRFSGIMLAGAALAMPGAAAQPALEAMFRDAPRHRSPNAGWPEAALAGALGLALGGPRRYGGDHVEDSWMGDGRRDLTSADIRRALRLYLVAGLFSAAVLVALVGI